MRSLIVSLLLVFTVAAGFGRKDVPHDPALQAKLEELDRVIERRDTYYMGHEHVIDSLKHVEAAMDRDADAAKRFDIVNKIYQAYKSFQNDSAREYCDRELSIARAAGDRVLMARAQTDRLFTYMSRGDFTNAVDVLRQIDLVGVNDSVKADFYVQVVRLYSDLSNFTSAKWEDDYAKLSRAYSDTVIRYASKGSYASQFASNFLYDYKSDTEQRISTFESMLRRGDVPNSIKAMLHSMLGDVYIANGNETAGLIHKAESAILDVKESTRETTSKHFLAYELYERGDIDRASRLIHAAQEDAEAYNAPQRKAEIGRALSLIEASRYESVDSQRNTLWILLATLLILLGVIAAAFILIHRRNKRLRAQKQIIEEKNEQITSANTKLSELNSQLSELNSKLRESIRIKDEYIGYGFYLNSEYIEKIESIYKLVSRKVSVGQADDLRNQLKLSDIKLEKSRMLKDFDKTFLRLFPTFIDQYSQLFPADDPVLNDVEEGILTPEMRIFALIRLGITDNNAIARFLNYSINTINTYKTKAKKRSIVANEEFEERIMQIRSVR